jgi:hypothetical protein
MLFALGGRQLLAVVLFVIGFIPGHTGRTPA